MQPVPIVDPKVHQLPADLPCVLAIGDLRLEARLGCGADERAVPQGVRFDLRLRFERLPEGSQTDRLEGTVCYADLSDSLRKLCGEREFHLIESLALEAYRRLSETAVKAGARLWLRVTKLRPPVAGLEGGASFELGAP